MSSLGKQTKREVAVAFGGNKNVLSDAEKGSQVRCLSFTHTHDSYPLGTQTGHWMAGFSQLSPSI